MFSLNFRTQGRGPRAPKLVRITTVASLLLALGFCGLTLLSVVKARDDAWMRAAASATNLESAVRQEIARTFELYDLSLRSVAENLTDADIVALPPPIRRLVLFDKAAAARQFGSILILDANGTVTDDMLDRRLDGVSFADREYFRIHRADPNVGLYISRPFKARLQDSWFIALSRRLSAKDGSFAGVVVGAIRLEYFRSLMEGMHLGRHGSMTLVRQDGTLVMQMPLRGTMIGADLSDDPAIRRQLAGPATAFFAPPHDQEGRRFVVGGPIESTDLVLSIAVGADDVDAEWWHRALLNGAATVLLSAALLTLVLVLQRQLHSRQAAEAAASESEARFRLLAENASDMVTRIGPDGRRRYVSPAAERLLGWPPEVLVGAHATAGIHPKDLKAVEREVERLRSGGADAVTVTYRTRRADGTRIWLETTVRQVLDPVTGAADGVVAISRDVTERKMLETRLRRLAMHDRLTALANRHSFDQAMAQAAQRSARLRRPLSLLLIDVDRFKSYNDRYGHQAGDDCLRAVAAAIRGVVRRSADLPARWGGEEFAVLLPDTGTAEALATAERLRAAVAALGIPHTEAARDGAIVTASVGVATLLPEDGGPAVTELLVEAADAALYAAKRGGRNRVMRSLQPPAMPTAPFVRETA